MDTSENISLPGRAAANVREFDTELGKMRRNVYENNANLFLDSD